MFNVYSNDTSDYSKCKKRRKRIVDGEFQTACSNACSTGAMDFGDVNDKESKLLN
jgi:molybdopterin-containing oxidoreductase family iron-sulfur binding subunit